MEKNNFIKPSIEIISLKDDIIVTSFTLEPGIELPDEELPEE